MKNIVKVLSVLLIFLTVTGCSSQGDIANRVNDSNNVDKVISEQINKAENENNTDDSEKEDSYEGDSNTESKEDNTKNDLSSSAEVDYDLTNMSSDMVYATVYQMMANPNLYNGKSVRMKGLYYPFYYEANSKQYHYCIIQDALACCAQGIEFVLKDESLKYPDDYPKEKAIIVVQGTFETYKEDDEGDILFCRLKDATMEVIN